MQSSNMNISNIFKNDCIACNCKWIIVIICATTTNTITRNSDCIFIF